MWVVAETYLKWTR